MDHSRAPMLEALRDFHRRRDVSFGAPGHRQGRGIDPRFAPATTFDFGASDSHRITARFTHSDRQDTAVVLVACLQALVEDARTVASPHPVRLPSAQGLELETVMRPRDAFFADVEQVPIDQAAGHRPRRAHHRRGGGPPHQRRRRGMLIPEAADPELKSLRVVACGE